MSAAALLAPVSDAQVVASPGRARRVHAWIDGAVLVLLPAAGLFCPQGPVIFLRSALAGFAGIAGAVVGSAFIVSLLCERSGSRLQGPRRRPALMLRGARDTALAAWVAACLLAWPLARMAAGQPTGLIWSLAQAGGPARVALQMSGAVLAIDAWLYWKHRLLHTRWLFGFHREHHIFRDPTALAGFAVGPVESLLTFWPIVLLALPRAIHYGPVYYALVVGFILLNLYLHCGVALRLVEATLPRVFFNTSAHHNRHHANAEVNFAEALTLWDYLCRTRDTRAAGISASSPR